MQVLFQTCQYRKIEILYFEIVGYYGKLCCKCWISGINFLQKTFARSLMYFITYKLLVNFAFISSLWILVLNFSVIKDFWVVGRCSHLLSDILDLVLVGILADCMVIIFVW
jgi:hypothetical protein